jgi:hypothetical protein
MEQIEVVPGDLRVLDRLESDRHRNVPAVVGTHGDWLDQSSSRVVWMDIHGLKVGSEILEIKASKSKANVRSNWLVTGAWLQNSRRPSLTIRAKQSPGASVTAPG